MTRNESTIDRWIRVVVGAGAIIWAAALGWSGAWAIILLIVGVVLVVTGAVGFCPLYRALGMSTTGTGTSDQPRVGAGH